LISDIVIFLEIDECQSNQTNTCEQMCVNVPGAFFCDCDDGYKLTADGQSCDDINECELINECTQKCINTEGSYNCSCKQFFKADPVDWRKCTATNKCDSNHGCEHACYKDDSNQQKCDCYANYVVDPSDNKKCKDIDECDPANPIHRCNQICENTLGGYNCSCQRGFELSKDGYDCKDINECIDEDMFNCTDEFHKCVNTRGSYKCECDQGLYFIDGKCRGLAKNETAPKPVLPTPRPPSTKEREDGVQMSLVPNKNNFKWDFQTDKSFKEKLASVTSEYCTANRTACALKEERRKRRAVFFDLYTADQVHLLPGYPKNSSGTLLVAFYVQQPLGLFIGNISVLPRSTLVVIVTTYKSALENATGTIIKGVAFFIVPTTPLTTTSTETPVEEDSDDWKWIVIGVCVGVVVIVLIIVIVFWCFKKREKSLVKPGWNVVDDEPIVMESYNNTAMEREFPKVDSGL